MGADVLSETVKAWAKGEANTSERKERVSDFMAMISGTKSF